MFRTSQYMRELNNPTPIGPKRNPPGPVVIWNLIRRCNLACKHCYSTSADIDFKDELTTPQIYTTMDDLKSFRVQVLILSGGEPLMHPDIFDISNRAKAMGFYVGLSSNGTLIDETMIDKLHDLNYDYVGISLDGIGEVHDKFRRKDGAFDASLKAIRLCQQRGIKVGIRFTLTQDNDEQFPLLLQLMKDENIDKFYLSHLNYAGRGNRNRKSDTAHLRTRNAMNLLFDACWQDTLDGIDREYVTGNNDADAVYLLHWVAEHFPEKLNHLRQKLAQWGGNSSGINIANIDNLGNVHPDTFWWDYSLGNVKQRPFSQIWKDISDPVLKGLRQSPRPLEGRCGACSYIDVCGGNTRVRAYQTSGNLWAEDPACYLTDEEIDLKQKIIA